MNRSRIKELFLQLKSGHEFLTRNQAGTPEANSKCGELVNRTSPIIEELKILGVDEAFSTALLVYGNEFLESLKKVDEQFQQVKEKS